MIFVVGVRACRAFPSGPSLSTPGRASRDMCIARRLTGGDGEESSVHLGGGGRLYSGRMPELNHKHVSDCEIWRLLSGTGKATT